MKGNTLFLASKYARAYDFLAKDDKEAEANLEAYQKALEALKEAYVYIDDPTISFDVKNEILSKILADNRAASFIRLLVSEKRFYLADTISQCLSALLDRRLGLKRVSVTGAVYFGDSTKERINRALESYFNSKIAAQYKEDKKLLAGLTVRQGDTLIDASATGRIKQLTKNLTEK
jgi:F-type H+-transporting ATPase subunit delta